MANMASIIVWDIETVPDLKGFAADEEIRAAMGDKFPKHIYHSIICIGALVAHREDGPWKVSAIGAPHVGERSEKALITAFVDRIAELSPQLVTFNGSSFDLPVLRYRALVHGVAAPGLSSRPYFNRYTEDAVDLCDVLSSFSSQGKVTLHELCRVMGLPAKPDGISGADVERCYREGRIREIAEYCESDVVNTFRVWLRYELFRGRISALEFETSEAGLVDFIKARGNTKPHLADLSSRVVIGPSRSLHRVWACFGAKSCSSLSASSEARSSRSVNQVSWPGGAICDPARLHLSTAF
jgi:3'-5' exonuclease